MKNKHHVFVSIIILSISAMMSCESNLMEKPDSELSNNTFLPYKEGIESVLFAAYAYTANLFDYNDNDRYAIQEMCTDILWQSGGGENGRAIQIIQFTWDASHGYLPRFYDIPYKAINHANIVIENIQNVNADDDYKAEISAEARFLRAINYYYLWDFFGPVPLRKSTEEAVELPRPSEDELLNFIETELKEISGILPDPGKENAYGRANNGASKSFLCKFYLNTKQWQKCVDMANEVISMNYYQLFPVYTNMFKAENDGNKEMIWVRPASSQSTDTGNRFIAVSTPPNFRKDTVSGIEWQNNWQNFASDYRLYDSFVNSFAPNDIRKSLILTSYIDTEDKTIQMLGNDYCMSWKYWPDPNANGSDHGNDRVVIRYADILLSKAEALNELNGPTQDAIDLINLIRNRAELPSLILSDFNARESLKDHILKERGWEFYSEEKRRRDLIRHGKFVEFAHQRGYTNVQSHHQLYPIPQFVMDSNPLLIQNEGY
ncbi:MAG: RagB/SusD family nutrient uptake outer membrane protein [Tannerellaceae bacterium]|jgi:hypothetical protein|nr:RagB/SusD family nutrient uptake outer membrane protein [Tannerellaceae bacterium]